ncbi:hypothetical protein [Mycobacterium aquaticum]|nr:hypothetical protein [Mycobacterium aquaticum]
MKGLQVRDVFVVLLLALAAAGLQVTIAVLNRIQRRPRQRR